MENVVITISRQYGSGGKTIAAMLAQKLGVNCYSREILKMASEDSGINEQLFGMSDEKIRHARWLRTLSRPYEGELLPPEDKEFVSDDNLFNYQAKVIKELAQKESCVIVGRCANHILQDRTLSVFIYAPFETRVKNVMERLDREEKSARKLVKRMDKERRSYYEFFTDEKWLDMGQYDLCIDSSKFTTEEIVKILKEAYER